MIAALISNNIVVELRDLELDTISVPGFDSVVFHIPLRVGDGFKNGVITRKEDLGVITRLEFMQRFTQVERLTIRTAAKQNTAIEDMLNMVEIATYINVTRPDTVGGVRALEAAGLIGPGRADEILAW